MGGLRYTIRKELIINHGILKLTGMNILTVLQRVKILTAVPQHEDVELTRLGRAEASPVEDVLGVGVWD